MKRLISTLICLAVILSALFIFTNSVSAEDDRITQLREEIARLEAQAQQYRKNIASEQATANTLRREISILHNQISQVQAEINATNAKISKTGMEIGTTEKNIEEVLADIEDQKIAIGRLMLSMYRREREDLVITLLKNEQLSDFFREASDIESMNDAMSDKIGELRGAQNKYEEYKNSLEYKKKELQEFNEEQAVKKGSLNAITQNKNTLLVRTKGQEAEYQKMLSEVEKRKMQFFNELRELETKAIQGGLYEVHITASNLPRKGTKLFQWPESGYRITQSYGYTTYSRRGAYGGAPHNGIDIAAGLGTPIKSVGDGEIVANGVGNPGWGNWVAIKHPPYNIVSVYGHMSSLAFLPVGSKVSAGQTIGYEGSTGNSTGSHLHLSLYKKFFTYVTGKGVLNFNFFEGSINPLDYL